MSLIFMALNVFNLYSFVVVRPLINAEPMASSGDVVFVSAFDASFFDGKLVLYSRRFFPAAITCPYIFSSYRVGRVGAEPVVGWEVVPFRHGQNPPPFGVGDPGVGVTTSHLETSE
jgi:hypothetical protein